MNTITTKRLLLRPLALADAPDIARLIGDYDVTRWLTVVPHPYSVPDAEDFIRDFDNDWRFGIELAGTIVGVIGITDQLGYWLGMPYWGHSYMSEAVHAVVNAWFLSDKNSLSSGYFVDNQRSGALLRKLGFQPGEIITQHSRAQARDVQCQQMMLSRADWQARHG